MGKNDKTYQVMVEHERNGRRRVVSYPASGHSLYMRAEAVVLLTKMIGGGCDPETCWIEGPGERATHGDLIDAENARLDRLRRQREAKRRRAVAEWKALKACGLA